MPLSGLFEVRVPAGSEEAWHGKGRGVVCRGYKACGGKRVAGGNKKRVK